MRLLIAQGPGYHGVNIRILSDEEAAAIEPYMDTTASDANPITHLNSSEDGIMVMLTKKVDINTSAGFDTGLWAEGEAAINRMVETAAAKALNKVKQGVG